MVYVHTYVYQHHVCLIIVQVVMTKTCLEWLAREKSSTFINHHKTVAELLAAINTPESQASLRIVIVRIDFMGCMHYFDR
jgi:hypothetical protein